MPNFPMKGGKSRYTQLPSSHVSQAQAGEGSPPAPCPPSLTFSFLSSAPKIPFTLLQALICRRVLKRIPGRLTQSR